MLYFTVQLRLASPGLLHVKKLQEWTKNNSLHFTIFFWDDAAKFYLSEFTLQLVHKNLAEEDNFSKKCMLGWMGIKHV
jgi:hypothetical protein